MILYNNLNMLTIGGAFEYKPKKANFSLNTDPFLLILKKRIILTEPISLKLKIGNKLKFCPAFGLFVRTNSGYGWTTGLDIEYKVKERLIIFLNGDFYMDYYREQFIFASGLNGGYMTESSGSFWISIGIKKNLLN